MVDRLYGCSGKKYCSKNNYVLICICEKYNFSLFLLIFQEGDMNPVEAYLNTGGDPTRKLTNPEVALLNRPSVYEAGHTLVHLAIK